MGPSWLRPENQAPNSASPSAAGAETAETKPELANAPLPWQVPSEQQPSTPAVEGAAAAPVVAPAEEHHGFPVMIFVVLVIAIIVAIGIFLFANGSLPGT